MELAENLIMELEVVQFKEVKAILTELAETLMEDWEVFEFELFEILLILTMNYFNKS